MKFQVSITIVCGDETCNHAGGTCVYLQRPKYGEWKCALFRDHNGAPMPIYRLDSGEPARCWQCGDAQVAAKATEDSQ